MLPPGLREMRYSYGAGTQYFWLWYFKSKHFSQAWRQHREYRLRVGGRGRAGHLVQSVGRKGKNKLALRATDLQNSTKALLTCECDGPARRGRRFISASVWRDRGQSSQSTRRCACGPAVRSEEHTSELQS